LGLSPKDAVSIFSSNCPEFVVYLLGLFSQSLTCVPLYPTLGPGSIEYILGLVQTECLVLSFENLSKLTKVLEGAKEVATILKHVIMIDTIAENRFGNSNHIVTDELRTEYKDKFNIEVIGMSQIIKTGIEKRDEIALNIPTGDVPAFYMFTSGSTGIPKGVILTHNNAASEVSAVKSYVDLKVHVRMFLYLPLQHIFSVIIMCIALLNGGEIYFAQPDIRQITTDLALCKPHILPSVPRVFQRFYSVIWAAVAEMPWYKRWYITRAYNHQIDRIHKGLPIDPTYDEKVFKVFREKLGLTECNIVVLGGSPTPHYIGDFLKCLIQPVRNHQNLDGWVVEGYGGTEGSGGSMITQRGDPTFGSIGSTLGCLQMRLGSVPDLDYDHKDGIGEVLLHGSTICVGYFKNPEEEEKVFVTDEKGRKWLKTGDVGKMNPNKSVCIVDRVKNFKKLANGEFFLPEKLLATYSTSPLVSQIFIFGSPLKSFVVAVVSPGSIPLYKFAKEKGWWTRSEPIAGSLTPEVQDEFRRIGEEYQAELIEWVKPSLSACEGQLFGFEKIKQIHVETNYNDTLGQSWNEANDLLTPTMKLKYGPLTKHYMEQLKELYAKGGEPVVEGEAFY
jgi:long-chain acyl-CoA synthetase